MLMQFSRDDAGFSRIATIDIETTGFDGMTDETVSIGVGLHERGAPADEATYEMFHRDGDGEAALIRRAYRHLNEFDADGLVSYNGEDFDFDFLYKRTHALNEDIGTLDHLLNPETHVDIYKDRKAEAERLNEKWPSLEECLGSYGWTPATTVWGGEKVTGRRFGDELGPAYLEAVDVGDDDRCATLVEAIEHYLVTDLEANLALYYGDIGEEFEPVHLGSTVEFSA